MNDVFQQFSCVVSSKRRIGGGGAFGHWHVHLLKTTTRFHGLVFQQAKRKDLGEWRNGSSSREEPQPFLSFDRTLSFPRPQCSLHQVPGSDRPTRPRPARPTPPAGRRLRPRKLLEIRSGVRLFTGRCSHHRRLRRRIQTQPRISKPR